MNLLPAQVRRAQGAIESGFIAQRFAIEHWDQFCTWAAKQSDGATWDDSDKPRMDDDSRILYALGGFDD